MDSRSGLEQRDRQTAPRGTSDAAPESSSYSADRVESLRAEMQRVLQAIPAISAALGPNAPSKLAQFTALKRLSVQLPNNQHIDRYREAEAGLHPNLRDQDELLNRAMPEHAGTAPRVVSFSAGEVTRPQSVYPVGALRTEGGPASISGRGVSDDVHASGVRAGVMQDSIRSVSIITRAPKPGPLSPEKDKAASQSLEWGAQDFGGEPEKARDEGGEAEVVAKLRGGWAQLAVYVSNRRQQVYVLLLWLVANFTFFVYKYLVYMDQPEYQITGACICVAKGAAEAIKLNMALILFPVSRLLTTFLRERVGSFFPFDYAIIFHQLLAFAILVWTLLHVMLHITCDYPRMAGANHQKFLALLEDQFDGQQPDYWGFLRTRTAVLGFMLLAVMLLAFPLAMPQLRRAKIGSSFLRHVTGFNAFWYSHMLLFLMFPLLIFHGSRRPIGQYPTTSTWLWIVAPMVIYAIDRAIRFVRVRRNTKQVDCTKAETFPGGVLSLTLTKPPGFKYRAGQYLFLQCPKISSFEWHPYSITSAPSDDFLRLHIRSAGDWTGRLHTIFQEVIKSESAVGKLSDLEAGTKIPPAYPRLIIDGPYGAPAQDFYKFRVVMLIGAGIGLTPFASVMRECHHQMDRNARQAPTPSPHLPQRTSLAFAEYEASQTARLARVEKVYLYWATKDRAGLTWFRKHLSDFSGRTGVSPAESMVELNNYLTQQGKADETRATPAGSIDSTIQEVHDDDVPMGTNLGRPDWDKVFARTRKLHPDTRIGVFFCGPRALSNRLCQLCCKYTGESTLFEYFKENF